MSTRSTGAARRTAPLVAALLLAPPLLARAQAPAPEIARDPSCQQTGSRARAPCEPAATVVTVEREIPFTIELPPARLVQCTAAIELEYTQRDTIARVDATLDHQDCAASSGEYTVLVRVRDASGETKILEFPVAWQRSDAGPVVSSADYEIGANADLLGVRTRQTRCTCAAEAPPAAP